jgi:hypothetical protein
MELKTIPTGKDLINNLNAIKDMVDIVDCSWVYKPNKTNAAIGVRNMSVKILPFDVESINEDEYSQDIDDYSQVFSFLKLKLSLKDIYFISNVLIQLDKAVQEQLPRPLLSDLYHGSLNSFRDMNHLALLTHWLVAVPLTVR